MNVSRSYEAMLDSIFQEELYSYCYRQKRTTLEVRLMFGLVFILRYQCKIKECFDFVKKVSDIGCGRACGLSFACLPAQ